MNTNPVLWLFDGLKKYSMEKYYLQNRPWGREDENEDIGKAIELVSDRRYERCLDVGAGLGHYTQLAVGLCDEVIAIDISRKAIHRAQKRLADAKNVDFQVRNLRSINKTWGTFDLIILGEVLYYLGDERFPDEFKKLIERIAACVRPGGRILLVHYIAPWRKDEQLKAYEEAFIATGLALEKSQIVTAGERNFRVSVIGK